MLYSAYSKITNCIKGTTITATIAIGMPLDASKIGVIMEFSGMLSKEEAEHTVKKMTLIAMEARKIAVREVLVETASLSIQTEKQHTAIACVSMW